MTISVTFCLFVSLLGVTHGVSITAYGAVGKNVTLSPSLDGKAFRDITWKKQKDKVVEWFGDSQEKDFPPFTGRVVLDRTSGNLTIFNLTASDEDEYEVELSDLRTTVSLLVFELLPFPILNCTLNEEIIRVQCVIPKHYTSHLGFIQYFWACPSAQCNETVGHELHFNKSHLPKEVWCTVSNPVSNMSSSMALESCVPKETFRKHWWIIAAFIAVAGVAILLTYYFITGL
ncbi:lymphocyte function-associated antigen 3 [Echinops telfairi]|uniref:Lymphocyte function-associated antigen 3 n=1 Tax=Echinops telfairi TaxID=9371 RepID=A0AC55CN25_ECHTE|nr:lymphocyte function-associated antigen 3 [Echinops telfairi]